MFILISILLGLGSMLAYAYSNVQVKPLRQTYSSAQVICLRNIWAVAFLAVCAIPTITDLRQIWWSFGTLLLGISGYVPLYAFMRAVKDTPIGIVSPIGGSSPLIAVLLSVLFLHTSLSAWQWMAAVIIVLANVAMSVDVQSWKRYVSHPHAEGIAWSLLAAAGWGVFFFLLVPFTEKLGAWNAALLVEVGVLFTAGMHMRISRSLPSLRDLKRPIFIMNGILVAAGTVLFSIGVQSYSIPIVQVLSNSTAFAASFFGFLLFRERLGKRERISGIVMTLAVIALVIL